jgi:hypothetical protein
VEVGGRVKERARERGKARAKERARVLPEVAPPRTALIPELHLVLALVLYEAPRGLDPRLAVALAAYHWSLVYSELEDDQERTILYEVSG